ncbi:hypothetical protein MASR1M32_39980 [Rhodobacter sp.]
MADITVKAAYGSVVEDEGFLFVGFAEGEGEDEPYALFRQPLAGGPVWLEVNDESFGAEDAVLRITEGPKGSRSRWPRRRPRRSGMRLRSRCGLARPARMAPKPWRRCGGCWVRCGAALSRKPPDRAGGSIACATGRQIALPGQSGSAGA